MTVRGALMNDGDIRLERLFGNYEKLEDTNKDKLLSAGKKLLAVKTLIRGEDNRNVKREDPGMSHDTNAI
jgi:hypothetical protein